MGSSGNCSERMAEKKDMHGLKDTWVLFRDVSPCCVETIIYYIIL